MKATFLSDFPGQEGVAGTFWLGTTLRRRFEKRSAFIHWEAASPGIPCKTNRNKNLVRRQQSEQRCLCVLSSR